jgi:hypothetical protein
MAPVMEHVCRPEALWFGVLWQGARMQVHLVDGTYELFRYFYSPGGGHENGGGEQVGAVRGVLRSLVSMLGDGAFRQFPWLEEAVAALGVAVWPMVDVEADDALAAAAAVAAADGRVDQVVICTPDKDLAQCVVGDRVVQFDRRAKVVRDAAGVEEKYGVPPASIPDWLALVGDSADGFPGLPGWGAKTAATVLRRYGRVEDIPHSPGQWDVQGLRGAAKLAATLHDQFDLALLFKRLAILETDVEVGSVDEWRWLGPTDQLASWCDRLDAPDVLRNATRLAPG